MFWLAAAATVALTSVGGHGRPALSVAYLGLRTLGIDEAVSEQLDQSILRALEQEGGVAVTSQEAVGTCKSMPCYCESGRNADKARALYGNTAQAGRLFTFELVLVDTQDCSLENSVFVTEEHDTASAQTRLASLVAELLVPPDTVSTTAVKGNRDVERAPAVLSVITAKQIRQLGITRVEDVFLMVPGFEIVDTNYMSRVLHHGIGGTVLILVDGVPLHNPILQFRGFGADMLISLNEIERIEFVRGPASVVWGTNALLGIVNFITRSGTTGEPQAEAHIRYGTLSTQEVAASLGGRAQDIRYYFGATASRTRGPKTFVEDSTFGDAVPASDPSGDPVGVWGNRGTTQNGYDDYVGIVAKLQAFDLLSIGITYYDSFVRYQLSQDGALLSAREQGLWDKTHLLFNVDVADDLPWGLRYSVHFSRHQATFWERFAAYPANADVLELGEFYLQGNEVNPIVNQLGEARLYHRLENDTLRNDVVAGVAYLHQRTPDIFAEVTSGSDEYPLELDLAEQTQGTASGFLHDDLTVLGGLLTVSGGVRLDVHDPGGAILNTQGGLLLDSHWVSAKLLYAEGFRAPTVNDRFSTSGILGVRDISAEKSRGLSAQATLWLRDFGEVRAGGSFTRISDLIVINRDNPPAGFDGVPENRGEIDVLALYGEARLRFSTVAEAYLTYSFKHLDESDPLGAGIPVAAHTASLGGSWMPANDLSLSLTGSFVSDRPVTMLRPTNDEIRNTLGHYFLLDASISLTNLLDHVDLGLLLRNPLGFEHSSPLLTSGATNVIVERRRVQEIVATVGVRY